MATKIVTFILVGVIIFVITLLYLRNQAKKQGRLLEKEDSAKAKRIMKRKLGRMALFRHWKVLDNLSLQTKKWTEDIDFLVVAPFGLLAVTVRGDKGEVYASKNDPEWLHINGPQKEHFPNLTEKNRAIQEDLRWVLSTEKIYKTPIYTLAVFTERKLELYFPANEGEVLLKKKLRKELKKDCYRAQLPIEYDKIIAAVKKHGGDSK